MFSAVQSKGNISLGASAEFILDGDGSRFAC